MPKAVYNAGERIEVITILSMWTEENVKNKTRKRFFQVRGSNGYEYKMYYDEEMKKWFLTRE